MQFIITTTVALSSLVLTASPHLESYCLVLVPSELRLLETSYLPLPKWFLSPLVVEVCDMVILFVAELSESIYSLYIEQQIGSFPYSTEAF